MRRSLGAGRAVRTIFGAKTCDDEDDEEEEDEDGECEKDDVRFFFADLVAKSTILRTKASGGLMMTIAAVLL